MSKQTAVGKVHGPRAMFFRVHIGEATLDGRAYVLSALAGPSSPIVHSKQSGRWFTLSWEDIINLAVQAGIDAPEEKGGAS